MNSSNSTNPILLDCTLRDGGYYNSWDFSRKILEEYLLAMKAAQVNVVELGFRLLDKTGFKGAYAYTTDHYLDKLNIPIELEVSVMINGSDLCSLANPFEVLEHLFPRKASHSVVNIVRCACHHNQFPIVAPAVTWLQERGYKVCINLMNIAAIDNQQIQKIFSGLHDFPPDVLYIADSTGSLRPEQTVEILSILREGWSGMLGVHTHDNLGLALENTLIAHSNGATWLDSTVTGMGRGPGNARTEELVIEAEIMRGRRANLVPLMELVNTVFQPMKNKYGWGTNSYYYLAGKYGIHPSYIQEMLMNSRYNDEDIFAVINHLRDEGGKKFSVDSIEGALQFYSGTPVGTCSPIDYVQNREILILGSGLGAKQHAEALEAYIRKASPLVIALNTLSVIDSSIIDLRIACHPVRLLADAEEHCQLTQPLITPFSMLPSYLQSELSGKFLLDYGLGVNPSSFEFHSNHCILFKPLVLAYALAFASSGQATNILMAGFDGYSSGDPRNQEIEDMLSLFYKANSMISVQSITSTGYKNLSTISLYSL